MTKSHENIAAITAEFHQNKQYKSFYKKNCDSIGGFTGIWNYCVDAALSFTAAERKLRIEWDGEYIEAVQDFVAALFAAKAVVPNQQPSMSLDKLAIDSIKQTFVWDKLPREAGWKSWSRNPGKPPVKYNGYYVLQMVDEDELEDHHFCVCYAPDGSWLTMDRRDMKTDAKRWTSATLARRAFKKIGGGENERITLVHIAENGDISEVEVLHDTLKPAEKTVIIRSSYGDIHLDPVTGVVLRIESEDTSGNLGNIARFDLEEYTKWDATLPKANQWDGSETGIEYIGYWTKDGKFEPPIEEDRVACMKRVSE